LSEDVFLKSENVFPFSEDIFPGSEDNFPKSEDNFPNSEDNFPRSEDNFPKEFRLRRSGKHLRKEGFTHLTMEKIFLNYVSRLWSEEKVYWSEEKVLWKEANDHRKQKKHLLINTTFILHLK
jgi:hypothetical protein